MTEVDFWFIMYISRYGWSHGVELFHYYNHFEKVFLGYYEKEQHADT